MLDPQEPLTVLFESSSFCFDFFDVVTAFNSPLFLLGLCCLKSCLSVNCWLLPPVLEHYRNCKLFFGEMAQSRL